MAKLDHYLFSNCPKGVLPDDFTVLDAICPSYTPQPACSKKNLVSAEHLLLLNYNKKFQDL